MRLFGKLFHMFVEIFNKFTLVNIYYVLLLLIIREYTVDGPNLIGMTLTDKEKSLTPG